MRRNVHDEIDRAPVRVRNENLLLAGLPVREIQLAVVIVIRGQGKTRRCSKSRIGNRSIGRVTPVPRMIESLIHRDLIVSVAVVITIYENVTAVIGPRERDFLSGVQALE